MEKILTDGLRIWFLALYAIGIIVILIKFIPVQRRQQVFEKRIVDSRRRPIRRESLQALRIANVRRDHVAGRQDDCRRGRNSNRRTALKRWRGIDRPAQAAHAFGPVEGARGTVERRKSAAIAERIAGQRVTSVIGKEHWTRILGARCEHEHALPALRESEGA